jgi:hypothetical protein
MTRGLAAGDGRWPLGEKRPSIRLAELPPLRPQNPRQVMPPAVVLRAGDLTVDEAVDALVADHFAPGLALQADTDLLGRPAFGEPLGHCAAQVGLPFEARARPASR